MFAVFIALAVPLGFSLQQIAFQTNAQRIVRAEIEEAFPADAEISRIDVDFRSEPILVSSTVYSPTLKADVEAEIERAFTARLGQPAELSLTQFQVGTSATAAQQAQLSAARVQEEQVAVARVEDLAQRLALVAGVPENDVTVDRTRRRALVKAKRLDGASLAAYRALELRIARTEPDWTIELTPPLSDLPGAIPFEEAPIEEGSQEAGMQLVPTTQGKEALDVIVWTAARIDVPIVLIGPRRQTQIAQGLLANRGVEVSIRTGSGPVRADWSS